MELFQRLNLEHGITIVFVTHNPETADYCERVVRIRDGLVESDERRAVTAGIHRTEHAAAAPAGANGAALSQAAPNKEGTAG
jgi:putative ABC transport system ATP-binding protein